MKSMILVLLPFMENLSPLSNITFAFHLAMLNFAYIQIEIEVAT